MAARTDSDRLLDQFRTLIPQIRQGSENSGLANSFAATLNQAYGKQLSQTQQIDFENKIQKEITQRQDLNNKEKNKLKNWFNQKLFALAFANGYLSLLERIIKQKLKLQKWARIRANYLKRLKSKSASAKLKKEFEKADRKEARISEKESIAYADKNKKTQMMDLLKYEPIAFTAEEESQINALSTTIGDNIRNAHADLCEALDLKNPLTAADQQEMQSSITELETSLQQVEKGLIAGHFDLDKIPPNLMHNLGEKLYSFTSKLDDMYENLENTLKETGQASLGKLAALDQWYDTLNNKVLGNWLGAGKQNALSDTERLQNKNALQATAQNPELRSETVQLESRAQTQNPYTEAQANPGLFFGAAAKQAAPQAPTPSPVPEAIPETVAPKKSPFTIPKPSDKPIPK